MKKLVLFALLVILFTGCKERHVDTRNGDYYTVIELDGCEYVKLYRSYGFQHKGNCKYCAQRDSIKWEKRKIEIFNIKED